MKVILQEIDKAEFDRLSNLDEIYISHCCIFDNCNDNIVAFPIFDKLQLKPIGYYKVLNSN